MKWIMGRIAKKKIEIKMEYCNVDEFEHICMKGLKM